MTTQYGSIPEEESQSIDIDPSFIFDYDELQEATNFFNPSEIVGVGGYGVVYRGKLGDGRDVAVKVLSVEHKKRIQQFFNEVRVVSGLDHQNLVKLYGCTNPKDDKLLLVYEYVPNGTVAYHLRGMRDCKEALKWTARIQIAVETAEALEFLHSRKEPIVHRDVKSDNILLDKNFNVKVADFGLCHLLPLNAAHVSTKPQGTQGYMDPEYNQYHKLTTKSDVFSFGVLLVELVSGKAVIDEDRGSNEEIWLVSLALNKIKNRKLEQLVDPELGYGNNSEIKRMVNGVVKLAYKCLQPKGYLRPTMMEVLNDLKRIMNEEQLAVVTLHSVDSLYSTFLPLDQIEKQLAVGTLGSVDSLYSTILPLDQVSRQVQPSLVESGLLDLAFRFGYEELQEAISFFSQKTGHGDLRRAYHGDLREGRMLVVKLLYASYQKQQQFYNEVTVLSVPRHPNLVAIFGCKNASHPELLLVYEFVAHFMVPQPLPRRVLARQAPAWALRIRIAIETAESLVYIHSLQPLIIHRDGKANNIVLDPSFDVEVAGRSLPGSSTYRTTLPQDTGHFKHSDRGDVYSFGIFLLELISGMEFNRDFDEAYVVSMVLNKSRSYKLEKLVDPALGYNHGDISRMVNSVVELAYKCLQPKGNMRPTMMDVLIALKGVRDGEQLEIVTIDSHSPNLQVSRQVQSTQDESGLLDLSFRIRYEELQEAINFFSHELSHGYGGFRRVYSGKIRDGRMVESKILYVCRQKHQQKFNSKLLKFSTGRWISVIRSRRFYLMKFSIFTFQLLKLMLGAFLWCGAQVDSSKVTVLSVPQHPNLVAIYGYTSEGHPKLLIIYEFMAHTMIRETVSRRVLARQAPVWALRIQIAIETAESLTYLHSLQPHIIHRDIKTDDILLDNNLSLKDTGLELSHILPGVSKYVEPKNHLHFMLGDRTDVYSFGVFLLELISGVEINRSMEESYSVSLALNKIRNKEMERLIDPALDYHQWDTMRMVDLVADLACRCLCSEVEMRPPIKEVLIDLKSARNGKQLCNIEEIDVTTTSHESPSVTTGLVVGPMQTFGKVLNSVIEAFAMLCSRHN